jgi:hypothetical protein
MTRHAATIAGAALMVFAHNSRAEPPLIPSERPLADAVQVTPGATCLEPRRVAAQTAAWLRRDRIESDIAVRVEENPRDPRAATLVITKKSGVRERRFHDLPENCDDETAVITLAIALAIDATALTDLVGPVEAPPRRILTAQLSAGTEVVYGPSVGLSLGVEHGVLDWLSARLDLLGQFSWGNTIDGTSGVFDAQVGALFPELCAGGPVTQSFRLELCSGVGAGILRVQGHRFAISSSAAGAWIVASAGARLSFTAGIPWVLDLSGIFPIRVPSTRAETVAGTNADRLPSPSGALLSVGPALIF